MFANKKDILYALYLFETGNQPLQSLESDYDTVKPRQQANNFINAEGANTMINPLYEPFSKWGKQNWYISHNSLLCSPSSSSNYSPYNNRRIPTTWNQFLQLHPIHMWKNLPHVYGKDLLLIVMTRIIEKQLRQWTHWKTVWGQLNLERWWQTTPSLTLNIRIGHTKLCNILPL